MPASAALLWLALAPASSDTTSYRSFLQAGDVVFVPDMWAHGLLYTRDSIGIAYLFHELGA
jgi:hypothetical protein